MEESVRKPKTWEELKDQYGGLERRLPENCVEYLLFLLPADGDARKQASALEAIRKAALELSGRLTKDFIWQREAFSLCLKNEHGLTYLHGVTDYGDSVEDEWLIVYILRELSKSFPRLWMRAFDADGEFLLVEAASVVPKWLSPTADANRAWIHDGKLFIIPPDKEGSQTSRSLSLLRAMDRISKGTDTLFHSDFVEAEAFYRLEKYPEQIRLAMHHSLVTIPRKLAYVLHERPKAIAPAVEEFYVQDITALRSLLSATRFPPTDLVTVSIRFTKVLYAQIRSQRFEAPPIWKDVIAAVNDQCTAGAGQGNKALSRLEIGMKLACGFEMLMSKADKTNSRVVREVAILLEDLEEDGQDALPTDEVIKGWKDVERDDDDGWMDIDFEQLERELQGKKASSGGQGSKSGFGDPHAQADLRKMVARFEEFLNDEDAGVDGAEVGDMGSDDEAESGSGSGSDSDSDSDEEDKQVSFDENEFSRLMREMMGMPTEALAKAGPGRKSAAGEVIEGSEDDQDSEEEEEEEEEVRKLMTQMEAELKEHGALKLDPTPKAPAAIKGKGKQVDGGPPSASLARETAAGVGADVDADAEDSDDNQEVDVDYNLAKNLLESFKSQAGMAGPAGNMLSMLGLQLPRDEEEASEDERKEEK